MSIFKSKRENYFKKMSKKFKKSKIVHFFQKLNYYRFKYSGVRDNSILIFEPNFDSHSEVLPYFIKYFLSRNYNVDVILSPFLNNLRFLDAVKRLKFRKYVFNPLNFSKFIKEDKIKEYKYIFSSSEIIYADGKNLSIFECFPELNQYKDKTYFVQHHLDAGIDNHTIALADIGKLNSEVIVANSHYFGEIKRHNKNAKTVNFVFVGALEKNRKDWVLLFEAAKMLINKGITNFHITHIGREKTEVPKGIEKYFSFLGYLDFKKMKKEIEKSDFYLMLLNPENEEHKRYLTMGTSGSFQLVYGFLKPCIIHKEYADAYNLSSCSIVYDDNNKFLESMEEAIYMQQEEYNQQVLKLNNFVENLERHSDANMDKVFYNDNKKIDMLFDASSLYSGTTKNANRSGIFFTAVNIFKCLNEKNNINVSLYCNKDYVDKLKNVLQEFQIKNVSFYPYDSKLSYKIKENYNRVKNKKIKSKAEKRFVKHLYYNIKSMIYSPLYHIVKDFNQFREYNCFFSVLNEVPEEIARNKQIKKYTILHDTIPLVLTDEEYVHSASSWFTRLINSINYDDYYICNSEYTKKDFLKYVPKIDKNKIFVSLLACSESFSPQTQEKIKQSREKYNIPEKYIFYIGNIEPRKNLLKMVKTFLMFLEKFDVNDLFLVIAGSNWSAYLDKLKSLVQSSEKYKDKIIFTGYVDDEDVAPLYSGALCSIYPSMYEGFGLPVLEAMSCGCPVITSNCTSLPEVAGDGAILIDCNNEEEYIEAYRTYYFDEEMRDTYKKKGFEQAKKFSWEKCTERIVDVIENTIN